MAAPRAPELLATLGALLDRLPTGVRGDARLTVERWGTMRFANSRIHQPHLERSHQLSLRVVLDQRLGIATGHDLSRAGLDSLVAEAMALARGAPKEATFPPFPSGSGNVRRTAYSRATAELSEESQARIAARILESAGAEDESTRVSGAVNTGAVCLAVANTSGLAATDRRSVCEASVLVERPKEPVPLSGWSEGASWDIREIRPERLGREAVERMARTGPVPAKPGRYRVLLDVSASTELFAWLAHLGFGGHPEAEGWSCLRSRRGKRVGPASLTVIDDATARASIPQSIDFEGVATRPTPLIVGGVAKDAVVDLATAGRLDRRPTGHGLPPESPWGEFGPYPSHILVERGDARFDELVKETRDGILVTRFHYVRIVDPGKAILTGMTRNGTYLIRKGEIAAPLRNLRFTESILSTLEGLELLGADRRRVSGERGETTVTAPALVSRAFRFTSATLF